MAIQKDSERGIHSSDKNETAYAFKYHRGQASPRPGFYRDVGITPARDSGRSTRNRSFNHVDMGFYKI